MDSRALRCSHPVLVLPIGFLVASIAHAQPAPPAAIDPPAGQIVRRNGEVPAAISDPLATQSPGWHFVLAAYATGPTFGGRIGVGDAFPPATIDYTAREVFSHPQTGGALDLQVRSGPWSLAVGGIYADRTQPMAAEYNFTGTVCTRIGATGAICGEGLDSSRVTGSAHVLLGAVEGFVFRRVASPIELGIGGVGFQSKTSISATVPTTGSGASGSFTISLSAKSRTETWGDPVIAARWTPLDGEHWHALLLGDVGTLGGDNHTWQLLPSVGYRFVHALELQLQYRALFTNYSSKSPTGTFSYDTALLGPQLGLALEF